MLGLLKYDRTHLDPNQLADPLLFKIAYTNIVPSMYMVISLVGSIFVSCFF